MEATSVIRYNKGQEYKPHHDFFHPESAVYNDEIKRGGNRIATVLFYLNDDFDGGETIFPDSGVKIQPKLGRCIVWENMFQVQNFGELKQILNYDSLHAGLPVISGKKYIATKWIRENKYT